MAIVKLAPGIASTKLRDPEDDLSKLAAIDIRLLLDFQPTIRGRESEEMMVAGKMRIVYSVPRHREYMKSGYPSEPLLAEAAANVWDLMYRAEGKTSANMVIPDLLKKFMHDQIIDKGSRGELVARLILTLAYDAAVRLHQGGPGLSTCAVPLKNLSSGTVWRRPV